MERLPDNYVNTAMLVMSATTSQAHIYDLLATEALLIRAHEVKAITVTSPADKHNICPPLLTPLVASFPQTSLLLPVLTDF